MSRSRNREPRDFGEHGSTLGLRQAVQAALRGVLANRDIATNIVLDPAVGKGELLLDSAETLAQFVGEPASVLGVDINADAVDIAQDEATQRGIDGEFIVKDILAESVLSGEPSVAVCQPPFGLAYKNDTVSPSDKRYPVGIAPRSRSEQLFVQIVLDAIAPNRGIGIVAAIPSFLFSPPLSYLREYIIDKDYLRAIIQLPAGMAYNTQIPVSLLVLDADKPASWKGKIQLVDARDFVESLKERQISQNPQRARSISRREVVLSEAGLKEIERSVSRAKPTPSSRVVTNESTAFKSVRVVLGDDERAGFSLLIPASTDSGEWFDTRYPRPGKLRLAGVENDLQITNWDPALLKSPVHKTPAELRRFSTLVSDFIRIPPNRDLKSEPAKELDEKALDGWEDFSNTIILRGATKAQASVVSSREAVPPEPGSLIRLNHDLDAGFFCRWFNSPQTQELLREEHDKMNRDNRVSLYTGFSLDRIDGYLVPTPSPQVQESVTNTSIDLQAAQSRLAQLEEQLWDSFEDADEIADSLSTLVANGVGVQEWADTLPFPLAASVQAYLSVLSSPRDASEQLLKFFEAYAAFRADYLVSAAVRTPDLWFESVDSLKDKLDGEHSIERASFGTWRTIGDHLASRFRKRLQKAVEGSKESSEEELNSILRALGHPKSLASIERILSSEVSEVLADANYIRNTTTAHGGTRSDKTAEKHHHELEQKLQKLIEVTGKGWAGLSLVRIDSARNYDTHADCEAEILMGARVGFQRERIETEPDPRSGVLYFKSNNEGTLFRLTGFVTMGTEPEPQSENTAYFFSRLENGELVSVAYQFTDNNEIRQPNVQVTNIIKALSTS